MEKSFTFRFYDISREKKGIPSLLSMLRDVAAKPNREACQVQLAQDFVVRLEQLEDDGSDAVVGEFTRCQSTNLPAELDGSNRKALAAKKLGHSIVFRFNHKIGALGIQYDPRVMSPGRVLDYISSFNPKAIYSMLPRIDNTAWQKFNGGQTRKLQIRISNPADLSLLEGPAKAAAESFKSMAEAYGAPSVTIEISMGHKTGFLSSAVTGLAKKFASLGSSGAYVDKMTAKTIVNDISEDIDLIEDRVVLKDTLSIDDRDPVKNYIVKKNYLSSEMKKLIG